MSMNMDQAQGAMMDTGGQMQEIAGRLVVSTKQQVQGLKNQAAEQVGTGLATSPGNLAKGGLLGVDAVGADIAMAAVSIRRARQPL